MYKIIITSIVVIVLCIVGLNLIIYNTIKSHGGVKSMIIEAGKEVKDIKKEIEKE